MSDYRRRVRFGDDPIRDARMDVVKMWALFLIVAGATLIAWVWLVGGGS